MPLVSIAFISTACILFAVALWLRQRSGIRWAPIIADDVGGGRTLERPLYSATYGLTGKPDYLIQHHSYLIPVEVKPTRRATTPYESDLMQLVAYCLLVEETSGKAPPYGLLRYAEQTFRVNYTPRLRKEVIAIITEMQALLDDEEVEGERSHNEAQRCGGCGFRSQCDQSLS